VSRHLLGLGALAGATLAALALGPVLGFSGAPAARLVLGLTAVGLLAVVLVALARAAGSGAPPAPRPGAAGPPTLLDTSVIIDGRIAGVCAAGFLAGPLTVPAFVLRELRQIADSPDPLRRTRGARGLDVLDQLERLPEVSLSFDARDVPEARRVDDKLLALARATGGRIATNDVELQRRAALEGVPTLSVNRLAQALRPVVRPGEGMVVELVKEGRETGQAVAYLEDGTMVVVDQGRRFIGRTVDVTVTTVRQTAAGRMIFARPRAEEAAPR